MVITRKTTKWSITLKNTKYSWHLFGTKDYF